MFIIDSLTLKSHTFKNTRKIRVLLPPGYYETKKKNIQYPVLYLNDGVLVLAATNAPWHVDPAFRRPGRFDRIIFVPPPDDNARASILDIKLKGKPVQICLP